MRVYLVTKKTIIRVALLILLISSAIFITMPYKEAILNVFNQNKEIPIYNVDIAEKKVAITFDCAWGGDDIHQIIEILKKYNVKATFFPVGDWMRKYPDNIKLLDKAGHEIANHSDTHADVTTLNEEKIKAEIEGADKEILLLTGKKSILFRPPYGAYNNTVVKTARTMGQYVIMWDVDSLDWKDLGVDSIVSRVSDKTKDGSIILLHNDTKYTVQALPIILEKLKSQGYEFVTVSELIYKDNYYVDYLGTQHKLVSEGPK